MPKRLKVWCVLALASAVGVIGCRESSPDTTEALPTGVTIHVVRQGVVRDVASAPGVVVPAVAFDFTVTAPEAGQIVELPKKETEQVNTGDLLVRFDIPSLSQELAARQLELVEATTRLDHARAETARLADLVQRGLVPRNAYESSRGLQTSAESTLAQVTAQLEAAKAAHGYATIRATFPGVIVKVWHEQGDDVVAGPADPVLRVVDPTHVQVAVQLPLAQLARIVSGQTATVRSFTAAAPFAASVAAKPGASDPNMATGEVRLAFMEAATLTVDSPVSVEILLDQRSGVLFVPASAVRRDGATSYVVVVGDDERAHRRGVRTGLVTRDVAEILSGLAAGDRVILSDLDGLDEGAAVVVAN